jgi:hypothetical protein
MAIFRGFVLTVDVRGDGLCEVVIKAVHAGNASRTFFIPNLDGDLTQTNKRLGQLGLLRDAVARALPVEVDYTTTPDQGDLIDDVVVHPRPSIDGRQGTQTVEGVVIGLGVNELWPLSGSSPYLDAPDLASVVILTDTGDVVGLLLDLQRPDPLTAQDELRLLEIAYRTRRQVQVLVSIAYEQRGDKGSTSALFVAGRDASQTNPGYIQATQFKTLPETDLDYVYAYIERLGQRYESFTAKAATAISQVKIVYTSAPGQTPEGDIADNGSFSPQRLTAWVHDDSPLLTRLDAALRDNLQVRLGLNGNLIHEVELVAHLGSSARPIWIVEDFKCAPSAAESGTCTNVPTVQGPSNSTFANLPRSICWRGKGYFQEGIWRFVMQSGIDGKLKIDGEEICCSPAGHGGALQHAYLKGLHCVELELSGVTCSSAFTISIYRIR